MTTTPTLLLTDAACYLTALDRDGAGPAAATDRLEALRRRHPDTRIRLLWQREPYDGSLHYDLLLTGPGPGTTSLSYCPDRALPWPLIDGQRASDRVLLRVDGTSVEIDEVLAQLDALHGSTLIDRLVTGALIRQELAADPADLTAAELQDAVDAFRRARGLLTRAATDAWLTRHGRTHADLERLVAAEAAAERLRARVVAGRIDSYFAEHGAGLAVARIWRVAFDQPQDAARAAVAIQAGADVQSVLEDAFARGSDLGPLGRFDAVRRDELPDATATAVFGSPPGTTLGPFPDGDRHELVKVLAVRPAVLDADTAQLIGRRLFARWLEQRVAHARVEWFWPGGDPPSDDATALISGSQP
ncbi:MAG: TIGR04500 family putative peptide maturation system protein [Frankia sp.]